MNEDAQYREQVRRDAIAMGWAPALAALVADRVGRPPTEAERSPHAGLRVVASRPVTTADRLQRIAAMFGASMLIDDFTAAAVSLRHVVAMLIDATGTARAITPGGIERIRVQLLQRGAAS